MIHEDGRIVLRQSWLGTLSMCPEMARQDMLGISESTESTSTMIGTAVHHAIEQCLMEQMQTGDPLSRKETVDAAMSYWEDNHHIIARWNRTADDAVETIPANVKAWWDQVRPEIQPLAVEHRFELPLVVDHKPEIWLQGTIDCIQEFPRPVVDWKNPARRPRDEWEKKRWSVQAAAYTWAVATEYGLNEALPFQFVYLVKGEVHTTEVRFGPAEWASLVALARSAGALINADLPVWPLNMAGWHCSPKWCGAWKTCRGRFAGPDPFNQL